MKHQKQFLIFSIFFTPISWRLKKFAPYENSKHPNRKHKLRTKTKKKKTYFWKEKTNSLYIITNSFSNWDKYKTWKVCYALGNAFTTSHPTFDRQLVRQGLSYISHKVGPQKRFRCCQGAADSWESWNLNTTQTHEVSSRRDLCS